MTRFILAVFFGGSAAGAKACTRISGGDPQQLQRRPGVSGDAGPTGAATAVPRISPRVWTMRLLGSKSKRSKILPTLQPLASLYWFNVVEFELAIVDQVRHRCIVIRLSFGIEFVFSKVLLLVILRLILQPLKSVLMCNFDKGSDQTDICREYHAFISLGV